MPLLACADPFFKLAFPKILSGILPECKTVLIQIQDRRYVGPGLGPTVFKGYQKSPIARNELALWILRNKIRLLSTDAKYMYDLMQGMGIILAI